MIIAWDKDDNRVNIDETRSNQSYYCPYCGTELIAKKGNIRVHHFAHKKNHICSDSWEREGLYDMSAWHNDWQNLFPIENQEVLLTLGDTKHRADVLIDKTVIEFQHSSLKPNIFDNRTNFYTNLGYKMIWLFDVHDAVETESMYYKPIGEQNIMCWKSPNRAFNACDIRNGKIDLFFQLYDSDKKKECIVRVLDVSENGFEQFIVNKKMTKKQFLDYVGMKDGKCLPPDRMELNDSSYLSFKSKYNIKLNKQQERALISVEGNNLLLAVPGSGKTTVLVERLGYMIFEKHINPKEILCLTFTNNAAQEMKTRFQQQFSISKTGITFLTINSLANHIYREWCELFPSEKRDMINPKQEYFIKSNLLKETKGFVSSDDVTVFSSVITYVKNMMLNEQSLIDMNIEEEVPSFIELYRGYCRTLKVKKLMDYDDQLIFAYKLLKENGSFSEKWKTKYKYICVDEAQDTSKIQHAIIKLISSNGNIFMVGDEDQSIYGFGAAYPKALLNFRTDYKNPFILKMEKNYRCTPEIVNEAQKFISKNTGRYEKNMISVDEPSGVPVQLVKVLSVEQQFDRCLEIAKRKDCQVAFLFRNNVSAIPLADLLLRNNISFSLKKTQYDFFNEINVRAVKAILKLALNIQLNEEDIRAISRAKLIHMHPKTLECLCNRTKAIGFFNALDEQMEYVKAYYKNDAKKLRNLVKSIMNKSASIAVNWVIQAYYSETYDLSVLKMIAKNESSIQSFLNRMKFLESKMQKDILDPENKTILSTIHNAKGKEFDSVYLVDVYDGRFPSTDHNCFNGSKDSDDGEQEERRLFYVALTRAKRKLSIFCINELHSSYIEELFPSERKKDISQPQQIKDSKKQFVPLISTTYYERPVDAHSKVSIEKNTKKENETGKAIDEQKLYEECLEEVKDELDQQEHEVLDHTGRRWLKCERCGWIAPLYKYTVYGGVNKMNLGMCEKCLKEKHKNN